MANSALKDETMKPGKGNSLHGREDEIIEQLPKENNDPKNELKEHAFMEGLSDNSNTDSKSTIKP